MATPVFSTLDVLPSTGCECAARWFSHPSLLNYYQSVNFYETWSLEMTRKVSVAGKHQVIEDPNLLRATFIKVPCARVHEAGSSLSANRERSGEYRVVSLCTQTLSRPSRTWEKKRTRTRQYKDVFESVVNAIAILYGCVPSRSAFHRSLSMPRDALPAVTSEDYLCMYNQNTCTHTLNSKS